MKMLAPVLLIAVCLSSCNTMIGFGRDLRQLGEGMENRATGNDYDSNDTNVPTY